VDCLDSERHKYANIGLDDSRLTHMPIFDKKGASIINSNLVEHRARS